MTVDAPPERRAGELLAAVERAKVPGPGRGRKTIRQRDESFPGYTRFPVSVTGNQAKQIAEPTARERHTISRHRGGKSNKGNFETYAETLKDAGHSPVIERLLEQAGPHRAEAEAMLRDGGLPIRWRHRRANQRRALTGLMRVHVCKPPWCCGRVVVRA